MNVSTTRPDITEEELRAVVMIQMSQAICELGCPTMRRVGAWGCDRLDDGDLTDRKHSEQAEWVMLRNFGLVRSRTDFHPQEDATNGYTLPLNDEGVGCYIWIRGDGAWTDGSATVPEGTQLFFDPGCTWPTRKT